MEENKNNKNKNNFENLKKKLENCKKEKAEYLAGWQRSRADFLNYKKQEIERMEELVRAEKIELILKILKIFDNFERAKKEIPENLKKSDWVKGIFQIENQFYNFLKSEGIKEIKTEGEKFNPNFHEAVEGIEKKDKESGTIIEVLEKGYLLNGQVLRPAKVKVAK